MVHKSCPDCDKQVPVACKACYCGFLFFEKKKLLQPKAADLAKSQISSDNIIGAKSRRTSRTKRERPDYYSTSEYENQIRRLSRASVSSEKSTSGIELPSPRKKRGRPGRPRKHGNKARRTLKKQTEKPTTDKDEERDEDVYSNIPPDQAFMYTVVLAEINRKLQSQWKGPKSVTNGINGGAHASATTVRRTRRNSDVGKS